MSNDSPTVENYNPANETEETITASDIGTGDLTSATTPDTAPEGASGATSPETAEEKARRSYTSPRVNMGNEFLSILSVLRTAWEGSEDRSKTDVLSVLDMITSKVVDLRDNGRPEKAEGEARVRSSTPNPYAGKHHYVARSGEGVLSYADVGKRPLPGNFPAGTVSAFGPFNTRAGAEYAVKHGIEGRNQIF